MRITNKMMSNNSLSNINTNKEYLDKLNNQMATEKKITRPSDDPIIAVRALRLRSNLAEIQQYYGANVPDAQAWVDVTRSAINSTKDILSSLKSYADQGANGTNTASDRAKIYENINALKKQVYSNGNVTNAGRSVFTGYRTGESLTFKQDTEAFYRDIKDSFNAADVVRASYSQGEISMDEINALANGTGTTAADREQSVKENEVNRIRLSYDDLNAMRAVEVGKITDTIAWNDGSAVSIDLDGTTYVIHKDGDRVVSNPSAPDGGEFFIGSDNKVYLTEPGSTLTYRQSLSSRDTFVQSPSLSIPVEKRDPSTGVITQEAGKDPVTGVIYTIKVTDETGTEITLHSDKGFTHQNSPVDDLEVNGAVATSETLTVHNDGTITFSMPDTPPGTADRKIYNISADGRTITSYYSEKDVEVESCLSTDKTFTNADGKSDDIYSYMRLNAAGSSDLDATKDKIYLVRDTGELIMGSEIAATLSQLPGVTGVDTISVTYDKTRFNEGDLKPQHYFDCLGYETAEDYKAHTEEVVYDSHNQAINYTIGTNQNIQINTYAEDVFDTQIMREIDDILAAIENMDAVQAKVDRLSQLNEDAGGSDENVTNLLKAANKELDLAKNKLQWTYEDAITQFGSFFDQANLAETACGTVENRLNLVSNRLAEEKTTVTTLASDNENVDITNIAVEVSEANLVYNAALMATGRISQQTLVDYI